VIEPGAGLVLQGLGLLALAAFARTLYRGARAARWPTTTATVTESRVAQDTDLDKNTDPSERPVLRYRYTVNGAVHESDRLYPHGTVVMSGARARQLVERHPPGSELRVRYDPARPGDAALDEPVPRTVLVLQLAAAIGFLVAGTLLGAAG
jgi:hypothetical protein